MPRPLLFDLDGTLVDSIALIVRAMHHAFDGRDHRPSDAEWTALIGTPLTAMLHRWSAGPEDTDHLIARYREYQHAHHDALVHAYPGVAETLDALAAAGHPMAIVTSKGLPLTERALAHVGIARHFRVLATIEKTTRHKPDPEPVWWALAELGVGDDAARAVFVGDSPHDMHAGNAAGVVTVAAQWGPFDRATLAAAQPSAWLDGIGALPGLLAGLDGGP